MNIQCQLQYCTVMKICLLTKPIAIYYNGHADPVYLFKLEYICRKMHSFDECHIITAAQ